MVGEFALELVKDLVLEVIKKGLAYQAEDIFKRRRLERSVEDAVAKVIEPLLPFLAREGVTEEQQRLLFEICDRQLRPFVEQPEKLFRGSLDGSKLFEQAHGGGLPEAIRQERIEGVYEMVFPRIATLLCQLPIGAEEWQREGWREGFRRFDEIGTQLRDVFEKVDALSPGATAKTDPVLARVRAADAQRSVIDLDITGLRADRPLSCALDKLFVHPSLRAIIEAPEKKPPAAIATEEECLRRLLAPTRRAIVVGPPGAGKSTWARWLHRQAHGAAWGGIAAHIEMRRLPKDELPSVHSVVRAVAGSHMSEDLDAARIRRWIDAGRVLFLLDGFDELAPTRRDVVKQWIAELAAAAPSCPVIVTSRPLTTTHLEQLGWSRWEMEPFDLPRIETYVRRWYRNAPLLADASREIDAEGLANSWMRDPTLGPLTGNPLLLSTLLVVHHLDGSLPSGRAELYRRYVDGMLGGWDDRRKVAASSVALTAGQKRRLLRGLALRMHLEAKDQLDEAEIAWILQNVLRELQIPAAAGDVLTAIQERSGLVVGPGVYSFVHKSVAEYLVAETLTEGEYRDTTGTRVDRMQLFKHRHDDRWNTVLFLWAGLAPTADVEDFVRLCLKGAWAEHSVAFGLLADQFDRFSKEVRAEAVVELTKRSQFEGDDMTGAFTLLLAAQPVRLGDAVQVPLIPLRGLGRIFLRNLLVRLIEVGELAWADFATNEGVSLEVRRQVWAAQTLAKPFRLASVLSCVTAVPSPDADAARWRCAAFLSGVFQVLHDRSVESSKAELSKFVDEVESTRPELAGTISLQLMGHCHEFLQGKGWRTWDKLGYLAFLVSRAEFAIRDDWLRWSRSFANFWVGPDSFDVLKEFRKQIESFARRKEFAGKPEVAAARALVERLEKRRDELERTPSPSEPPERARDPIPAAD